MTGLRPNRSEMIPRTGEKPNCISAQTEPKIPAINDASAIWPPVNVTISGESTGVMIPKVIMSSAIVMNTKVSAARRGAAGPPLCGDTAFSRRTVSSGSITRPFFRNHAASPLRSKRRERLRTGRFAHSVEK
jgi:hypothetical protein